MVPPDVTKAGIHAGPMVVITVFYNFICETAVDWASEMIDLEEIKICQS